MKKRNTSREDRRSGGEGTSSSDEEAVFRRSKRSRRDSENVPTSSDDVTKRGVKIFRRNIVDTLSNNQDIDGAKSIPTSVIMQSSTVLGGGRADPNGNSSENSPHVKNGNQLNVFTSGVTYKSSATDIMRKMGFEKGKGFGRMIDDFEISQARLNAMDKALADVGIIIEDDILHLDEEISIEEDIRWIPQTLSLSGHPLDYPSLMKWKKIGPSKTTMSNESMFLDSNTLKELIALKKCFSYLTEEQYQYVRSKSNPFEKVGKGPFICRAGVKMANLDAVLSFALTQPIPNSSEKHQVIGSNELFYFADMCAGPGGFSEYVLFRKNWGGKGFGMTLKGRLDFDIWSSTVASAESFEAFYGPADDGDIYNPDNTAAFIRLVMASTEQHGVHLMMADGGFDVENKEMQEIASAQIYLSQCYLALALIRPGGMFVCKLFDTLTPFTVGLIYLMYLSFEHIGIHKPKTSRPANSERYLICKWKKKETTDGICAYLSSCHSTFWKWSCQGKGTNRTDDITELVPLDVLQQDAEFYEYIRQSNARIADQQIKILKEMIVFSRNAHLVDRRQDSLRQQCFEFWRIPEAVKASPVINPDAFLREIIGHSLPAGTEFLGRNEFMLTEHNVEAFIRSPFDWRIVVIEAVSQERNRGFYMSMGRTRIYRYTSQGWVHITDDLELCKNTLLYGEFVEEVLGKKPNQAVMKTFHIIDAMVLGGKDVRGLHYTQRHEVCIKFAKSMNKPTRRDICPIRAKNPVRMENIADVLQRLENRTIVRSTASQLLCPVDHTDVTLPFIRPAGILFLKITKDPWTMALSRSSNRKYYFNLTTGASSYCVPEESISDFDYTMQNRMLWWWDKDLKTVLATQDVTDRSKPVSTSQGTLNPQALLNYVESAWQANKNSVMRRLSSTSSQGSS